MSFTPFLTGIHLDGAGSHPATWSEAGGDVEPLRSPGRLRRVLAEIEAAGFDFVSFAGSHLPPDGDPAAPARLDPVQQAAFAAPLTSRIALLPEVPVTYVEPFHTATQLASLDYAAEGRGGWLVSGENSEAAARQYGREALSGDDLAAEVIDVVAVVRRLWDTWEDEAVIKDLPSGRYIDREKLHYADFSGRSFSVKGPAITPRPPQGQLPVAVPLAHAEGVDADIVLVPIDGELEQSVIRARSHGAARVIADLEVLLDSRGEAAADRAARLDANRAWRRGPTERFIGTSEALLARFRELREAVDGVRLIPASVDRDLDELRYLVLPALFADGEQTGTRPPIHASARRRFGLPPAVNSFVTAHTGSN